MTTIKLVVGLGNPGAKYAETRHNAGFWFLDQLSNEFHGEFRRDKKACGELAKMAISGRDVLVVRPETYVNESGRAVSTIARYFGIAAEEILIVYDELDLDPGQTRLKAAGGHGGHNGMRDIVAHLGSNEFPRLRLGIGHPGSREKVVGYVLGRPSQDDRTAIDRAIVKAVSCMPDIVDGNFPSAMQILHEKI